MISPKSDMIRILGRKKYRMKRFWIIAEVVCEEGPVFFGIGLAVAI